MIVMKKDILMKTVTITSSLRHLWEALIAIYILMQKRLRASLNKSLKSRARMSVISKGRLHAKISWCVYIKVEATGLSVRVPNHALPSSC